MTNSKSKLIYDNLVKIITSKTSNIGDKLPTEMDICKKYDVARSTVREAISMLHTQGYVEVRKGSGTYIVSKDVHTNTNVLVIDKIDNLKDFMEIRKSIEILAVRLFIKNFSDANLKKVIDVEAKFEKAVKDKNVDKMSIYDEAFHSSIIESTDNSLLISIGDVLSNSFKQYRNKTFENESHRQDAIGAHKKIIDSLKRKDTNDAIYNIQEHLNTSCDNATK